MNTRIPLKRIAALLIVSLISARSALAAPPHLVDEAPASIKRLSPDLVLIDFGRVAFGNLRLTPPAGMEQALTVHFGEAFDDQRIDRTPPGTVRYATASVTLDGAKPLVAAPPADARNIKQPAAVLTPSDWGVVLPFRWVEIEGWQGELTPEHIVRQSVFASTWDDEAAAFHSSDEMLNRIWELCRYSIKATTFAGVYVDGDRERIPYEADAYLNQLSHYATDNDLQMARDTFDHLMAHPTWPTEWAPHMVFMAYADWMQSGDIAWLAPRYESLKSKILQERAGPDGLITSTPKQIKKGDIVDWPKKERDGYVFTSANTVVNAFHLKALAQMAEFARAVGKPTEAADFFEQAQSTHAVFQQTFFNTATGIYRDGIGTDHSSQHANLFPLAFGLVPSEQRPELTEWVGQRGMACSVYAAQYLLEALFENDAAETAVALITAHNDRSWRHMVESGTTITWEAWDQKYKPNQDWNHAWGAAPANLLPRYILGAQPLTPGWQRALIRPNPAGLGFANGKVPTPLGPIQIDWTTGQSFQLSLTLPENMQAMVELPHVAGASKVLINDQPVPATQVGNWWILESPVTGTARIELK